MYLGSLKIEQPTLSQYYNATHCKNKMEGHNASVNPKMTVRIIPDGLLLLIHILPIM